MKRPIKDDVTTLKKRPKVDIEIVLIIRATDNAKSIVLLCDSCKRNESHHITVGLDAFPQTAQRVTVLYTDANFGGLGIRSEIFSPHS